MRSPVVTLPAGRTFLGVYDPDARATGTRLDAELAFVQWKPSAPDEVRKQVEQIRARHRVPFLTIEPYPWNVDGLTAETLFSDVASGRYDATIRGIAGAVSSAAAQPVYLRFAHEMDLTGNYPWSRSDAAGYIAMYRHFVQTIRAAHAANARFVWSPAGNANAPTFYPGPGFVDLVGVTTLEFGDSPPVSFAEKMQQRYTTLASLGKPIAVCEFGIASSDREAQTAWITEARRSFASFPLLRGVIYFNAVNPTSPHADWRLTPGQMAGFAEPLV